MKLPSSVAEIVRHARSSSLEEMVAGSLNRLQEGPGSKFNAWIRVYEKSALAGAAHLERLDEDSRYRLPLLGLPIGVKDVIAVAGHPVTASSDRLRSTPANESAVVWRRLERAGALAVGHCHTHEFAAGSTTDQCGNPWDPARSPGGSSGGSAVAVASGDVPVALGTDTAGSLRIPSALCGISTIKASRGMVSNEGVIPLASTFDTVGPMAFHVRDVRTVFEQLLAPTSRAQLLAQASGLGARGRAQPIQGLRFAVLEERTSLADAEVQTAVREAASLLEGAGASKVQVDPPLGLTAGEHTQAFLDLLLTDVWAYHQTLQQEPGEYGEDVSSLVAQAATTSLDREAYRLGLARRARVALSLDAFLDEQGIGFLLEPTCPTTAPLRVAPRTVNPASNRLAELTTLWNYTGNPVVALPAGLGRDTGLPVGLSLIGRRGDDLRLLAIAEHFQELLPPPVWSPA